MKQSLIFLAIFILISQNVSAETIIYGRSSTNAFATEGQAKKTPLAVTAADVNPTLPPIPLKDVRAAEEARRKDGNTMATPLGFYFPEGHRAKIHSVLYGK